MGNIHPWEFDELGAGDRIFEAQLIDALLAFPILDFWAGHVM
jgi:hypothetical protein